MTTVQVIRSSKCIRKYLVMSVVGARSFGHEIDRGSKHPDSMVLDHFLRNRETSAGNSLRLTLTGLWAEML